MSYGAMFWWEIIIKKKHLPEPSRPLFDRNVDAKMYQQLTDAFSKFQTEKIIQECLHEYDTQINEGLNMTVSRYVPKFEHYGTTMSLDTRIRCAKQQLYEEHVDCAWNMGTYQSRIAILREQGQQTQQSLSEKRKQTKRNALVADVQDIEKSSDSVGIELAMDDFGVDMSSVKDTPLTTHEAPASSSLLETYNTASALLNLCARSDKIMWTKN